MNTDIRTQTSKIVLAPMEGVIDAAMRSRLTALGGYSRCVTEFVRVSDVLLPKRVFYRLCPELQQDGLTPSGVPVYVQLLGSNPDALALNAQRAAQLGAPGVDLNFGCPAKTVNKSMGGSVLLQEPERVARIVASVRDALPVDIPLTVKIRIGYHDAGLLGSIVEGIWSAGANELAIHARTKFDGYKPPAHWHLVGSVVNGQASKIYINGEIWTVPDSYEARRQSGCLHIMLGRGALAAPDLARRIQADAVDESPMPWSLLVSQIEEQFLSYDCQSPRHIGNRTKQWLAYLKRHYPEAAQLFARLRTLRDTSSIAAEFKAHRQQDLRAA
jgi:tRNA-dihydrouridine synthase C